MGESKQIFKRLGNALAVGTLTTFLGQIIGGILLGIKPEWRENTTALLMVSLLSVWVLGYPVMTWMLRKLPTAKGERLWMSQKDFILCIFLTFASMYLFNYLGVGIYSVFRRLIGKEAISPIAEVVMETNYVALFFLMVIGAPIIEELFYRKVLIDKTIVCGKKTAILSSALIFALVHGNFQQSLYTFFLGLFLAFIYVKTSNIIYPIVLHMIINFFGAFLSRYLLDQLPLDILEASEAEIMELIMSGNPSGILGFGIFTIVVWVLMIAGIIVYIRNRKKFIIEEEERGEKGKRLKVILCNVGMILFTIYYGLAIILSLVS